MSRPTIQPILFKKDNHEGNSHPHCAEPYRHDAPWNRRTAIYCWAVARHFGGKFLLRIEDTDQVRSTKEAVQVILDGMKWLNLDYDEGPVYQMDRLARYQEVVDEMLADGRAYYCYATPEELDALREQQRAAGLKPRYDGRWRPENCVGRPIPEGVKPSSDSAILMKAP